MSGGLVIFLFLSGCAATPQSDRLLTDIPEPFRTPTELEDVAFFPQTAFQCGPAALATVLARSLPAITVDELVPRVYIPARKGSLQIEMIRTVRDYQRIPYVLSPDMEALFEELNAGRPVLVLQNLGVSWYPRWHYAVLVGYDLQARKVVLRSGETRRYVMDIHTFEHTWRRSNYWALVVLAPGELPSRPDSWSYLKSLVAFEKRKDWALLDAAYQAGLRHWPGNRDLLMAYGTSLYLQSKLDAAVGYFRQVVVTHPDYAPAYNNLAQVLLELNKPRQALTYARKAVDIGGVHAAEYQATLTDILEMLDK